MRRSGVALLMTAALLLASTTATHAQRGHGHGGGHSGTHGRVVVGAGPTWWGPIDPYDPYPWPYPYPRPYPYSPYYGYPQPPIVIQEEPPVYAERQPPAPPEAYWYYCPNARAYYPDVNRCPEGWVKVPPSPEDE